MVVVHLMRRGWLSCPSFFFSSLFNAKVSFSTSGLCCAPFNSTSQLLEVRWASSVPWPIVAIQPLHGLGKYFPRTSRQYSLRSTCSKMLSPPLLAVLDRRPPTIAPQNLAFYSLPKRGRFCQVRVVEAGTFSTCSYM